MLLLLINHLYLNSLQVPLARSALKSVCQTGCMNLCLVSLLIYIILVNISLRLKIIPIETDRCKNTALRDDELQRIRYRLISSL